MVALAASPSARLWTAIVVLAVVLSVPVVAAPPAAASFLDTGSAAQAVSSAQLQPASGLSATTRCGPLLSFSARATLSWTATPSTFATGYTVERWRGSLLESTTTVTPRTTTTVTQTGLSTGTLYTWKVRAFVSAWTSTEASVSAATPGPCL